MTLPKPSPTFERIRTSEMSERQTSLNDAYQILKTLPEQQKEAPPKKRPQRQRKWRVKKERQTYAQSWHEYDQAKTNQTGHFLTLITELALAIQTDKPKQRGRTGYLAWEKIVSMTLKEYYKSDLRKTQSILKLMAQQHTIPRVPNFRTISTFYNDPTLTPLLEKLLLASSLPLSTIETTGMIDATGFSTKRYQSWNQYKWGKHHGKERVWVKLHAWGCPTSNIIIGAKITDGHRHDAPMLKTVLGDTPKLFNLKTFVADKAYSSREIVQFLCDLGLTPRIPFKKNTSIRSKGAIAWHHLFKEFLKHQEDYMNEYHQRSNMETCFHMLKQRFGERLATKNFTANQNEILVRILCHNLCVLIQEAYERHVEVDWDTCLATLSVQK